MRGARSLCAALGGFLALLLLAGCQSTPEPTDESQRLLVTFHENVYEARRMTTTSPRTYYSGEWGVSARVQGHMGRLSKRYGLRQVDVWPIRSLGVQCAVFVVDGARDLDALLAQVAKEPGVESAQPLNEFEGLNTASSAPLELQWGEHAPNVVALHQLSRGGTSRVGIVDTLVDEQHPDLAAQITRQYAFVDGANDKRVHGTAVAGVIAANGTGAGLVGIAPDAQLYVYGACRGVPEGGARCDSFNLAKALEQAHEDGVGILNLSLAGPHDPLLARLLRVLLADGTVVIAAASPALPSGGFPASLNGVFGVSGVNGSVLDVGRNNVEGALAIAVNAASAAPLDPCLHWIFDPEKLSTRAGGGYQFFYGSSMSAAGASGFAALLRSKTNSIETMHTLRTLVAGDAPPSAPQDEGIAFVNAVRKALVCDAPRKAAVASNPPLREEQR